jgi:hypothetical protein
MTDWICIKRIPNTIAGLNWANDMKLKGECHHRRRGRGARCRETYQDKPLIDSTHFSQYAYPIGVFYGYGRQYWAYKGWRDGKPVVRQLMDANG